MEGSDAGGWSFSGCVSGFESLTRRRDVLQEYNGDDYQGGRIVSKACALRDAVRCVPGLHSCDENALSVDSGNEHCRVDRRVSVPNAEMALKQVQVAC
jgi:hypothetical protein